MDAIRQMLIEDPVNEPQRPEDNPPKARTADQDAAQNQPAGYSTSRWVDYNTHELLDMISQMEDERRMARLREGVLWAILAHLVLLSVLTWIPRYVFKEPKLIDPFDAIKQRKDLTYLDLPPDALKSLKPKVEIKPLPKEKPLIDKQTMEEMKKNASAPTPQPEPQPQPQQQAAAPAPIPPAPQSQSQFEAPRPQAVPARPSFNMNQLSQSDMLREAMKGSMHGPTNGAPSGRSGLPMHPGAGTGGVQILSDTQGVDFNDWIAKWYRETRRTWDPLIPDEVNAPIYKSGMVVIRFKVLPNGRLMEGGMVLEGRSGDTALDRAGWGALTGSNYPPLPHDFHGPYLELRVVFLYNMKDQ